MPQAAQNTQFETHLLLRDLIKDTPLVKESRKRYREAIERRRRRKKAKLPPSDPQLLDYKACALPLCYNCSP